MDTFQAALAIGQTRTQLALGLVDLVSYPLLAVVVAWPGSPSAAMAFCRDAISCQSCSRLEQKSTLPSIEILVAD